jgi:ABC-type lipoprotein export system ATPase subunit
VNDETTQPGMTAPTSTSGVDVHARNLQKRYGEGTAEVVALGGVDVDINPGEAVALMGPSGSGKSTLLHLTGAMDLPTSGTLQVGDTPVQELRGAGAAEYRRTVGFVFQAFHLLAALSVLDNVLAPLIPLGQARAREDHAVELLTLVGLGDRLAALPSELSGGQRQRVAIARALINSPRVILADEPTGNLDTTTGSEVTGLLLSLREQFGTTLILATHDGAVAGRLDRTIHLTDGNITHPPR